MESWSFLFWLPEGRENSKLLNEFVTNLRKHTQRKYLYCTLVNLREFLELLRLFLLQQNKFYCK